MNNLQDTQLVYKFKVYTTTYNLFVDSLIVEQGTGTCIQFKKITFEFIPETNQY